VDETKNNTKNTVCKASFCVVWFYSYYENSNSSLQHQK